MIVLVLAFILSFLVYRHYTWKAEPWPSSALRPPLYQGHRGYWRGGAQENTLAAFRAAAERGLQMIEMDVRLSLDRIPVVVHDEDLLRIAGRPEKVVESRAADLLQWAQVPSLEQVLTDKNAPSLLNIEIKSSGLGDGLLEKKIAELILKHRAQDRVLFSSFNPLVLARVSKLLPEVPRALLATQEKERGNGIYLRNLWLAPYIRIHLLHLDHRDMTGNRLAKWKKRNIPVALWTVNEADTAKRLLSEGAVSIISDTLS